MCHFLLPLSTKLQQVLQMSKNTLPVVLLSSPNVCLASSCLSYAAFTSVLILVVVMVQNIICWVLNPGFVLHIYIWED